MDNWYLVYCKPRQEQRAQQHLANQGFESFVPLISVVKLRAGKRVKVTEALFPRYLFLKAPEHASLSSLRSTRGVNQLVRFGDELAKVPSSLIENLLQYQLSILTKKETTEPFQAGESLTILSGPFASLNAVFSMPDGESRSIVMLNFLGQQLQISLENTLLTKQ